MTRPPLAGLSLLLLHVLRSADALSFKEADSAVPVQAKHVQALHREGAEDMSEIPPTNQAQHRRPKRRRSYRRLSEGEQAEVEEQMESYRKVTRHLGRSKNMSHSRDILQYVMSHPKAPALPRGGCLYLPNNAAWVSFYSQLEHPDPPLFVQMIANSYYPGCNATSLTGVTLPASCGANRILGSNGCFAMATLGRAAGIEVYETLGHVGLPDKWAFHLSEAKQRKHVLRSSGELTDDEKDGRKQTCGTSDTLRDVSPKSKLVIPTAYVICRPSADWTRITPDMVREQNRHANEAYRGGSPWERMEFDFDERPESVDMQIEFNLTEIRFVDDPMCARYGFTRPEHVTKYNTKPLEQLMIVVITDDHSGTLGQSEFPDGVAENSEDQIVIVSSHGFRKYPGRWKLDDIAYDEGDTVVHEVGHGLGLKHTFEGGCSTPWGGHGDYIDDTAPEALPHYMCRDSSSCGERDPVHNFMDYSPDTCMVGFTKGQKRRAWCMLENFRNTLFKRSLRTW